jgi:hypothetical protein
MTYHIKLEDFYCPTCLSVYIPYEKNLPCPKCGSINVITDEKYFEFIPKVLLSMKAHKSEFGRYVPDAWYRGSYAELIQSTTFKTFDTLEKSKNLSTVKIKELLSQNFSEVEKWEKDHLTAIELSIFDKYREDPWFSKSLSFTGRFKQSLARFSHWVQV